jgi:hypothetical protein
VKYVKYGIVYDCVWISGSLFLSVWAVSVRIIDDDWLLGERPEPGAVIDSALVRAPVQELQVLDFHSVRLLSKGQAHRLDEEILRALGVDLPLFVRDVLELVPHEFVRLEGWADSLRDFAHWEKRGRANQNNEIDKGHVGSRHWHQSIRIVGRHNRLYGEKAAEGASAELADVVWPLPSALWVDGQLWPGLRLSESVGLTLDKLMGRFIKTAFSLASVHKNTMLGKVPELEELSDRSVCTARVWD